MRLLIASDIHGSASRTADLCAQAQKRRPDTLLLLGDILYHGPRNPLPDHYNPAEVIALLSRLDVPVIAVRGNCDAEVDQLVLPWQLSESAWIFDGQGRILAAHGHQFPEDPSQIKAAPNSAILSGHTHIPIAEKRGPFHFWNPGSLSLPKNSFPPSFALYEEGTFTVVSFDGKELMKDSIMK